MLYQFLLNFVDSFSFLNVFKYLTFRTGLSFFTSLIIVLIIGGTFIKFFSKQKILNPIRNDGPEDHIVKKIGTPTMGGIIILIGLLISVLFWADLSNLNVLFCLYIAISFGLLGAFDDYKKIKYSNSSGISSKLKLTFQIILAIIGVSFYVYFNDYQDLTNLYFPFFKNLIRWFSNGTSYTCCSLFCIYKLCYRKHCILKLFANSLHRGNWGSFNFLWSNHWLLLRLFMVQRTSSKNFYGRYWIFVFGWLFRSSWYNNKT